MWSPRVQTRPTRKLAQPMEPTKILALSFDTGGTFTDLSMLLGDGRVLVDKVLSTPSSPARAVLQGIDRLLLRAQEIPAIASTETRIVGATTVVTNAVLERRGGARAALLVTEGFADLLVIRDESRYDLYDLQISYPDPLVARDLTFEVPERMRADGVVHRPLSEQGLGEVVDELTRRGVTAVAVCLIHGYQYPEHEQAVADFLRARGEFDVSLSSEISGEAREYERASTTAVNAYTRPLMRRHISELTDELTARGLGALSMMTSSGNVVPASEAADKPVRMIESGPAAGAIGAGRYAALVPGQPLLAFDMGGTTAKLSILRNGTPIITRGLEVDRRARFKEGSGIPLDIQSVKLIEIGAGGGSIAHPDHLGLLALGPESAGAEPGPACYARGGTQATVTDADLLLGYLDAGSFLGGTMALDEAAAEKAIAQLAEELETSTRRCAWGIHELANEVMARSAAAEALESGVDPRECALVAFGGAGPTHAYGIARRLDISTIIYPAGAGIASALGLLSAPVAYDCAAPMRRVLSELHADDVNEIVGKLLERGRDALGRPIIGHELKADMRYAGQGYELSVPVPDPGRTTQPFADECRAAFLKAYEEVYGRLLPERDIEITMLRLRAIAEAPRMVGRVASPHHPAGEPRKRMVDLGEDAGVVQFDVLRLADLRVGSAVEGPVIIEQDECSPVVPPGAIATIASSGDVVVTIGKDCK